MATALTTAANWSVATTAGIRDWAGRIEALLGASGWVPAADSGQTAASALPAATTAYQVCGYQIWRMADALQATAPIFLKIEFGSGSNAAYPSMAITIGTGSDGVGNITGVVLARVVPAGTAAQTSCRFIGSGGSNRFWCWIGNNAHALFLIERTKDLAGADTDDGVIVLLDAATGAFSSLLVNQLTRPTGIIPPNSTSLGAFVPSGATWSCGSNYGVCPVRFFDGQPSNPCVSALVYLNADIAALSTPTASIYGTSHTYFALGTGLISTVVSWNSNSTLMLIYE